MRYPNLNEEKKLWKKGYRWVVGIDEAGRGPLAGPVFAAAVWVKNLNDQIPMTNKIINPKSPKRFGDWALDFGILGIKDSKKLSPKKREEFYKIIKECPFMEWGIGRVSEKMIDKINILEATKLAMTKAVKNLERKIKTGLTRKTRDRGFFGSVDFLIVDGNMKLNSSIPYKSIIKADEKVLSCALASIIAKVERDKIMRKNHKKYPEYGFDRHKGYGTRFHYKMLEKHGPSVIHRQTFNLNGIL